MLTMNFSSLIVIVSLSDYGDPLLRMRSIWGDNAAGFWFLIRLQQSKSFIARPQWTTLINWSLLNESILWSGCMLPKAM